MERHLYFPPGGINGGRRDSKKGRKGITFLHLSCSVCLKSTNTKELIDFYSTSFFHQSIEVHSWDPPILVGYQPCFWVAVANSALKGQWGSSSAGGHSTALKKVCPSQSRNYMVADLMQVLTVLEAESILLVLRKIIMCLSEGFLWVLL